MALLDEEIDRLAKQYLTCCQKIAARAEDEDVQRQVAHTLFLTVEELRHQRSTDLYKVA